MSRCQVWDEDILSRYHRGYQLIWPMWRQMKGQQLIWVGKNNLLSQNLSLPPQDTLSVHKVSICYIVVVALVRCRFKFCFKLVSVPGGIALIFSIVREIVWNRNYLILCLSKRVETTWLIWVHEYYNFLHSFSIQIKHTFCHRQTFLNLFLSFLIYESVWQI